MSTADLAIVALTGLNLMQGGCFYYRDKQLIGKLADRVQLPKAPAAPPSVPDKASKDKPAPADGDQPLSILGGKSGRSRVNRAGIEARARFVAALIVAIAGSVHAEVTEELGGDEAAAQLEATVTEAREATS